MYSQKRQQTTMPDHQQHIEHKKYAFKLNKGQRSVTMSLQLRYTKSVLRENKNNVSYHKTSTHSKTTLHYCYMVLCL